MIQSGEKRLRDSILDHAVHRTELAVGHNPVVEGLSVDPDARSFTWCTRGIPKKTSLS